MNQGLPAHFHTLLTRLSKSCAHPGETRKNASSNPLQHKLLWVLISDKNLFSQARRRQSAWFQLQRTYHHALCATSTEPAGAVKIVLPGKVPSMSSSMPSGFCTCELGMNMVPPLSCLNSSRQINTCALDWHHAACQQLMGVGHREQWSKGLHGEKLVQPVMCM